MKALLVMGLLTLSSTAFSSVVKSYDAENSCELYRVIFDEIKDPIKPNERLVTDKNLYGLTLKNLEVDFDAREVKVQIIMNVVLGLNKPLLPTKSIIAEENPQFTMLINEVNHKIQTLDKICITIDNKIIYARVRPTEE